ncbi:GNAT family N-acetyltransferase [Weissella coleopterorum]|uniref:GNAT family N-acetyltransferase n=1 Tax=Weissella coleopterorum TaxID=2714949 RepID=A0A6G8B1F4_9LACO|nr:GNAT family N-acetyltransferase [Weissella coleopterorum]QIL51067.1 GNAT family N-acetyltransferase [Weissella coleopterorum]
MNQADRFKLEIKQTSSLTALELLEIMQARVAVFVVEQDCPYQEIDAKDEAAWHVILKEEDKMVAYARIVGHDDGVSISFGRVLVVKPYRQMHLGRTIVMAALTEIEERFPEKTVKIAAQEYLRKFYETFGFKAQSEVYLEDGIPHLDMILEK